MTQEIYVIIYIRLDVTHNKMLVFDIQSIMYRLDHFEDSTIFNFPANMLFPPGMET